MQQEYDESSLTEDDYERYFTSNWKFITVIGFIIFAIIYGSLYWFDRTMREHSNKKVVEAKSLIDKSDTLPREPTPQTLRIKEMSTNFLQETIWIMKNLSKDSFPRTFDSRLKQRYLEASPAYSLPDNWKQQLPPSVDQWAKRQRAQQRQVIQRFINRLENSLNDKLDQIKTINNLRSELEDVPLGQADARFNKDLKRLQVEINQILEAIENNAVTGPKIPRSIHREIPDLPDLMADVAFHLKRLAALTSSPGALLHAEEVLQDALRIDPKNPRAYYQLGRVYDRMNLDIHSGESFARALRKDPDFQKKDDILKRFRKRLQKNPDSARNHYDMGFALYETGNMSEAEKHLFKVLELEEDNNSMTKVLAFKRLKYIHQGEPPYHIMALF